MPADDLVLNVRQIAGYPAAAAGQFSDALLIQRGGLGGPYLSLEAQELVATALLVPGLPLQVGVAAPADAAGGQLFTDGIATSLAGWWMWNGYNRVGATRQASGPAGALVFSTDGFDFYAAPPGGALTPIDWGVPQFQISPAGQIGCQQVTLQRDPAGPMEAATAQWVQALPSVRSFNMRFGDIMLTVDDIVCAGGAPIFSPVLQGSPRAPTPNSWSNSSRIATTAFVQMALAAAVDLTGYAPLASPNFSGVPSAPTAAAGTSDGQIATTSFVMAAVAHSTTGVVSFNGRTGLVVLSGADLNAAGGALLASPAFTGTPQAPTAVPGTSTGQLATTAFVMAAVAAATAGVSSFNGRTGVVTLTAADVAAVGVSTFNGRIGTVTLVANDVSAVGGALLASPAFTGSPTAPTAAPGSSTTQLATCAFVTAAIATVSGVSSFNGRTGAVALTTADLNAAGGALLASPAFTGTPQAPTATAGTSTAQLATCAFVQNAVAAATAGVSSFNGRTGVVALIANDISAAGGALLASPAFTGVPAGPTAGPATSTTQLATTAFVAAAIAPLATTAALAAYLPLTGGTLTGQITGTDATFTGGVGILGSALQVDNAAGQLHAIRGSSANSVRWTMMLGDGAAESGANAGANFGLAAIADNGATVIGTVLSIARATGAATFNGSILNVQPLTGTLPTISLNSSVGAQWGQLSYDGTAGNLVLNNLLGTATSLSIASTGVIVASTTNCEKPSGGPWMGISDARIKDVHADYELGLDEVLGLRPVVYSYRGNDAASAGGPSPHQLYADDQTEFVGLVAQEAETILPGMVGKREGWIDGKKVADLRTLDTGELVYALVNAVKTLAARLAAIEGSTP